MAAATLYVTAGCAWCAAKRAELAARGVTVTELDVGQRPELIPELLKLTNGRRIVPVVVEGPHILVAQEGGSAV